MNKKYKLLAAVSLVVFVLPFGASAQTMSVSQLQQEIQSLTAQLQTLQAQLAAAGGSTATWCHTFTTNLSIGMSGSDVTALQTALQKDGESVTINGTFDDQTAAAVTGFQEKYASQILAPNGLTNGTGYAGVSTRAELNSLFGCGTPISASSTFSLSPSSGPAGTITTLYGSFSVCGSGLPVDECTGNRFNEYIFIENGSIVASGFNAVGFSADEDPQIQIPTSFAPGVYELAVQNCFGKGCINYPLASFTVTVPVTAELGE